METLLPFKSSEKQTSQSLKLQSSAKQPKGLQGFKPLLQSGRAPPSATGNTGINKTAGTLKPVQIKSSTTQADSER